MQTPPDPQAVLDMADGAIKALMQAVDSPQFDIMEAADVYGALAAVRALLATARQ